MPPRRMDRETKNKIHRLIGLYKSRSVLWDHDHGQYNNAKVKADTWDEVANKMDSRVADVKNKMRSLLASFERERRREESSLRAGEDYCSNWFAFKSMQFLKNNHYQRSSKNTAIDRTTPIYYVPSDASSTSYDYVGDNGDDGDDGHDGDDGDDVDGQGDGGDGVDVQGDGTPSDEPQQTQDDKISVQTLQTMLETIYKIKRPEDDCSVFGEFVAGKLRPFDDLTKTILQQRISNLIYDFEINSKFNGPVGRTQKRGTDKSDGDSPPTSARNPHPTPTNTPPQSPEKSASPEPSRRSASHASSVSTAHSTVASPTPSPVRVLKTSSSSRSTVASPMPSPVRVRETSSSSRSTVTATVAAPTPSNPRRRKSLAAARAKTESCRSPAPSITPSTAFASSRSVPDGPRPKKFKNAPWCTDRD